MKKLILLLIVSIGFGMTVATLEERIYVDSAYFTKLCRYRTKDVENYIKCMQEHPEGSLGYVSERNKCKKSLKEKVILCNFYYKK